MPQPSKDTLQPIAQVLKSYGTFGAMFIRIYDNCDDYFKDKESVFLFYDRLPVPFSISSFTRKGNNKAIIKFEEIDSLPEAEEVSGQQIFAPAKSLTINDKNSPENFVGFDLYDQKNRKVGIIGNICNFSGNICFKLEESEILIPYNEALLISSDEKKKTVCIKISQGLL